MKETISIAHEIVEKAYEVAEEVIEGLHLPPGSYDAKQLHSILFNQNPDYVLDNNSERNNQKYTIQYSLGQLSGLTRNIFQTISKLESKARLGRKRRKIWTVRESRTCQYELDITMPNQKQMEGWSSEIRKIEGGNRYMIFSLRDEALYFISNSITAKISNRDVSSIKPDLHPNIYFWFSWFDIRKIYGKCKIQLYYDHIMDNSYQGAKVVITNEDGWITSSVDLPSTQEVETLKRYQKHLSQPYSEKREA